jgi:hypothetical protein
MGVFVRLFYSFCELIEMEVKVVNNVEGRVGAKFKNAESRLLEVGNE